MVDRERQCCGFLSFQVTTGQDGVTLVIEAPKEVADVLDTVFAPFLAGTSEDGGCTCCGHAGTECATMAHERDGRSWLRAMEIGRETVCTPVTNAQPVCRLTLDKTKTL